MNGTMSWVSKDAFVRDIWMAQCRECRKMQENHRNTWKDANVASFSLFEVGLSLIQSINSKEATIQSNNSK